MITANEARYYAMHRETILLAEPILEDIYSKIEEQAKKGFLCLRYKKVIGLDTPVRFNKYLKLYNNPSNGRFIFCNYIEDKLHKNGFSLPESIFNFKFESHPGIPWGEGKEIIFDVLVSWEEP